MRLIPSKPTFFIWFLFFLLVIGCEKEILQPTEKKLSEKNSVNNFSKTTKDSSLSLQKVIPMRPENCSDGRVRVYHNTWEAQNQFRLVLGKNIGVMGDGDMIRNHNYFTQYGCRMVLVNDPNLIGQLHSYGYSLDSIFIGLSVNNWQQAVNTAISLGVHRFYIDEPIRYQNEGVRQLVLDAAPYIGARGGYLTISESEFNYYDWYIIQDKGNIEDMVNLALEASPHPFVSCHTHFEYHWVLGVKLTLDPRDQWSYIMSRVPSLFKMAIIKSRQSYDEMDLLFGHANNLGITQILLYPFQSDATTYAGVQSAIETAHSLHWVEQYQKQVREEWCCPTVEWDPYECRFESSYYTGYGTWY